MTQRVELIEKAASGVFGAVWRAKDDLGRIVAVKIIAPSMATSSDALEHARALARAQHPNVVHIYFLERLIDPDTNTEADGIVMEWLDGETWRDRRQRTMGADEAKRIGEGILDAIEHMHAAGVTHGDLHDENIMIARGIAKVIDPMYRESDTLAVLSTTPRAARLRKDVRYAVDRLDEALEACSNPNQADFRRRANSAETIAEVRNFFADMFVTRSSTPRRTVLELLADVQSSHKSLVDVIRRTLDFADNVADGALAQFCERELSGVGFEISPKHPDYPAHRECQMFITVTTLINPAAPMWGGSTGAIMLHMETHPDDFQQAKRLEDRPIGILEREGSKEGIILVGRKLRAGNFVPNSPTPDLPVHAYERPGAEARVVEKTRVVLATLLSAHLAAK